MYVNVCKSWLVVKVKGQSSIFRRYAYAASSKGLKTFTTRCHYISSWPWPLTLILISIIASCLVALRLVVFHIFNFSGLRFLKKKVFLSFVDLHLFAIPRTSVKVNRNFWGLSDSDRKNISVFSSFAWKVREVAIAWRFHTCKYHSFWLVAIAKFQPYASIVLQLVVFPGRRANYGFIISRKQNRCMKALQWVAKQKCHLRKETIYMNKRSLFCGVKTL